MSAGISRGRKAPVQSAAALPPQAPAKTLSGAFAAALGKGVQMPHPPLQVPGKDAGTKRLPTETKARPSAHSGPAMPTVPRKGHR